MKITNVLSQTTWQRILIAFVVFVMPVFMFVELADEVRDRDTKVLDESILRIINSTASPALDVVMMALTQFGGLIGVLVITGVLLVLLWRKRLRRMAVFLTIGVGGASLLNLLLKTLFQRDRPELWERIVTENSYSFPSGHAMASSALACSLMVIFWPTRWRWWVVAGAGVYMVLVGLSRLYLGVHYPTDIAAGWLVSGAWVAVVTTALRYPTRAKPEAKKLENSR